VPSITKHAHDRGMPVTGHVPASMLAADAIAAGFDGIEHMNNVVLNFLATKDTDPRDVTRLIGEHGATLDLASTRVRDFIALLRANRVVIDPTFVGLERMFTGVPGTIAPGQEDYVGRLPTMVWRQHTRGRTRIADDKRAMYRGSWERMLQMAKLLHDNGVPVVIGSDATAGLMLHREFELFAQAGFDNATILAIATLENARALKLDGKIGSITAGKRADLVIVDGDPIADLRSIRNVVSTMRAGVVYPSRPLYDSVGVK
jgi:imidazolonepropionase-like amidohydrolase